MEYIISFFKNATRPRSLDEDTARQEFILNILLVGILILLVAAIVIDAADMFIAGSLAPKENALSSLIIYGSFVFFLLLYLLSRTRHVTIASYLFLGAFFVLTAYMGCIWGIDVPAQIVFYPLLIIMAGILISTRFAFLSAVFIALTMGVTGYLQRTEIISVNTYWKNELWTGTDITMIIIIYLLVAVVSWLSNRELEKSLERARKSEQELKEERDLLEIRVEERTHELRKAEIEKMSQAYNFVEFGRLAGGIFHDLINPLTALSLNIERIAGDSRVRDVLADDIDRARLAAAHMQQLMVSMRRHLAREGGKELFDAVQVLNELAQVLSAYARAHQVEIAVRGEHVQTYDDPVAFTQIMTNVISNAIQSYPPRNEADEMGHRNVLVTVGREENRMRIDIADTGSGIPEDVLPKIFDPFFTTKESSKGLGIGLSLVQRIVEKLEGAISVNSVVGEGTVFTIYLPIREP